MTNIKLALSIVYLLIVLLTFITSYSPSPLQLPGDQNWPH